MQSAPSTMSLVVSRDSNVDTYTHSAVLQAFRQRRSSTPLVAIGDGRPTEGLQAVQMSTNLEGSIAVASFLFRACPAIHHGFFIKILG